MEKKIIDAQKISDGIIYAKCSIFTMIAGEFVLWY